MTLSNAAAILILAAATAQAGGLTQGRQFLGVYSLKSAHAGACHERLEVTEKTFLNAKTAENLQFSGLPRGTGRLVAQVLDVNQGLQTDIEERPYPTGVVRGPDRPRLAVLAGGLLSFRRPDSLFLAELTDKELSLMEGEPSGWLGGIAVLRMRCVYVRD